MPYQPEYSPEGLPYAPFDPHREYDEAVRWQAEDEEIRRYGEVDPEWGRTIPEDIRQPSSPGRRPLYHRDRPYSPDEATGHRSEGPAPYIPARLMNQVQKHHQNDTSPLDSRSGSVLQHEEDVRVGYLLQRLRESRTWPRSPVWDEEQSPTL
jgi:hypothetical protein